MPTATTQTDVFTPTDPAWSSPSPALLRDLVLALEDTTPRPTRFDRDDVAYLLARHDVGTLDWPITEAAVIRAQQIVIEHDERRAQLLAEQKAMAGNADRGWL